MTLDATLAILHHLAIFSVAAVLAAEWVMVRPGMLSADIRRLVRIDSAYGAMAGIALAVGFLRVFLGAKPSSFYINSATFWLKIAAFAVVGLLSIRPTLRYLRWKRAIGRDPTALPEDSGDSDRSPRDPRPGRSVRMHPSSRSPHGSRHRRMTLLGAPPHKEHIEMEHSLDGWHIGHQAQGEWSPWGGTPGTARAKHLAVADGYHLTLVDAEAGYTGDAHDHTNPEFLYVIDGHVRTQGVELGPGDGYVATAGSVHTDFATDTGATYVLIFKL